MSYQHDRDQFIVRMTREGLPFEVIARLLRAATTLQRLAELACSSEAADRDRIACPASCGYLSGKPKKPSGPCICDRSDDFHQSIPRIRLQEWQTEQRIVKSLPAGWSADFQGDPRGYVLRVIPPSYAERNRGKDRHNLDSIGVPARDSRLRF
jgi:hypothetical protein